MLFLWLIGILLVIDLSVKAEIESCEEGEFPKNLDRKGRIILHKSHNAGLPFGFLKGYPEAVKMIPVITASAVGGYCSGCFRRRGIWWKNWDFPWCWQAP